MEAAEKKALSATKDFIEQVYFAQNIVVKCLTNVNHADRQRQFEMD